MPRSPQQKRKLLILLDTLQRQSDENHPLPLTALIEALAREGISAERKAIYDDLETLRLQGYDIQNRKREGYYLGQRPFQLAELKLLVDAVQSSKFISQKKSAQLISKLEGLTSVHEAAKLQRQVYVDRRLKTANETVYYAVDALHDAIAAGRQVTFRYFDYDVFKRKAYRHEGALYQVSPYALLQAEENYYLVAFDAGRGQVRHYRVDKMERLTVTGLPRGGREAFAAFALAVYSKEHFGMYGGRLQRVKLRFRRRLVGVALDRFGQDATLIPDGEDWFTVSVQVAVSPQFFGWLFGLGDGVELAAPEEVRLQMARQLQQAAALYEETTEDRLQRPIR